MSGSHTAGIYVCQLGIQPRHNRSHDGAESILTTQSNFKKIMVGSNFEETTKR